MPPPLKIPKGNLNNVNEISDIFRGDSSVKNTRLHRNQNRLISSTPSTSLYSVSTKTGSTTSNNLSFQSTDDQTTQDASSDDSCSITTKPSLENSFSSTQHLDGTRSLFSCYSPRYPIESLQKGTNFDVDAFVNKNSAKKLKNDQAWNSPFYVGKTMFGGASSASYLNTTKSLAFSMQNPTSKSAVCIQPIVLNAQDSSTNQMSQTARQILSTLEQFAKPIAGPVKTNTSHTPALVQNAKRFGNLDQSFNRSRDEYSPVLANKPYMRPNMNSTNTSFQKELQVATVPELLKILHKNKLQKSTLAARKLATTSTSDLIKPNSAYKLRTEEDNKQDKPMTKVKNKISSVRQSKNTINLEEPMPELKLPSAQLNITSMPKFDFKLSQKAEAPKLNEKIKIASSKTKSPNSVLPISKPSANKYSPLKFSFEHPSQISHMNKSRLKVQSTTNYKFQNPDKLDHTKPKTAVTDILNSQKMKLKNSQNIVQDKNWQWECKVCYARSYSYMVNCICCNEPKRGSEIIIYVPPAVKNASTSMTTSQSFQNQKNKEWKNHSSVKENVKQLDKDMELSSSYSSIVKEQNSKWECTQCLTRNDVKQIKCVCCETLKTVSKKAPTENNTQTSISNSFKDLIKAQNAKWECGQCLTRNDSELVKCICCDADKSKPLPVINIPSIKIDSKSSNSFQDLIKKQNSKWECSQCLTRNELEKDKCICCEALKPGSSNLSSNKISFDIGKLKPVGSTSFDDIVKKQNQKWECSGCMTHNEQHKTKCVCCEALKPGTLNKKSQYTFSSVPITEFKFGMDKATDVSNKFDMKKLPESTTVSSVSKDSTSTSINQTFSFGMPAANKIIESKKEDKENEPKPKEISGGATFVFGMPENVTANQNLAHSKPKMTNTSDEKPLFQFGQLDKQSNSTSIGIGISPSSVKPSKDIVSGINTTSSLSKSNSTTTASSASTLFTFGNSASLPFNGSSLNKNDVSTKSQTTFKPLTTESSVFNVSNNTITDNGEHATKKANFAFESTLSSVHNSSPVVFGANLKSPFTQIEKPKSNAFQFTANATSGDQKKTFSFSSNTANDKSSSLFVFGDNNSGSNSNSSAPFVFGASTQNQTNIGFDTNKSNNMLPASTATSVFGSPPSTNTPSNNLFGSNTNFNTMFSFGSNSSKPLNTQQGSALFTFGNSKQAAGDSNSNTSFKFELGSNTAALPTNNFNFGTEAKAFPSLPFQIGAAPSEGRKIKKAVRRTPR